MPAYMRGAALGAQIVGQGFRAYELARSRRERLAERDWRQEYATRRAEAAETERVRRIEAGKESARLTAEHRKRMEGIQKKKLAAYETYLKTKPKPSDISVSDQISALRERDATLFAKMAEDKLSKEEESEREEIAKRLRYLGGYGPDPGVDEESVEALSERIEQPYYLGGIRTRPRPELEPSKQRKSLEDQARELLRQRRARKGGFK